MRLHPEVDRVLKEFHTAQKPLGLCCIAPALAAKALARTTTQPVEVTLGSDQESPAWPFAGTCGAVTAVGGTHVVKAKTEVHVDVANKLVTSPAYMSGDAKPHEVEDSVKGMITEVMKLA